MLVVVMMMMTTQLNSDNCVSRYGLSDLLAVEKIDPGYRKKNRK